MGKLKPFEGTDEEFLQQYGGGSPSPKSGAKQPTPPPNNFDGWTHDQLCTFLSQPGGKYPCAQGSYHLAQPPQAHVRTEAPAAADSLSDQALKADLAKYPNLAAWCNAHHITHLLDDNGQPAVTCVKANHMTDAELSAAIYVSVPPQPEAPRMKIYTHRHPTRRVESFLKL